MAATLRVQNTGSVVVGSTGNCSLVGVQAGDLIGICVREENGVSMGTPSSNLDGVFTLAISRTVAAAYAAIWFLKNASAGTHVVTVPTGGGNTDYDWNANAWGGCETTGGADQTAGNSGSGVTSVSHGTITPSASALILTAKGGTQQGTVTPGPDGMTALNVNAGAGAERPYYQYKVGHTGAVDGDYTTDTSHSYDAVIAAFLESAGGGGGGDGALLVSN